MVTDLPFSPWLAIEFQVQRGSWFIELPTSPACLLSCLDYLSIVRLFSSVQSLSPVSLFATPWTATCQASLSIQTYVHWVGDATQPSHPLLSPSPPAFNLPQHQGLSNESVLWIMWPKYWSFSFSISPSNEYSGLVSFGMD